MVFAAVRCVCGNRGLAEANWSAMSRKEGTGGKNKEKTGATGGKLEPAEECGWYLAGRAFGTNTDRNPGQDKEVVVKSRNV